MEEQVVDFDLTPYMTPHYNEEESLVSQFEKLLQRISALENNMRFKELKKVLERLGYEMKGPSSGSSHMTFRKKGHMPITIPVHDPIKRVYVEKVKEIVEGESEDENS